MSVLPMPIDLAKKLMNKANPKDTGLMHGMLAVHMGMKIRLLEALDVSRGLVKDAEGEVVHIACHPSDQDYVDAAMATGADAIYLKHLPLGFWVKMDKYDSCPRADLLDDGQEDAMRPFGFH